MRRLLAALVAVVSLSACTPDLERLVAYLNEHDQAALAAGMPCADYAGALAFRGLPDHFLIVMWRESKCQPFAVSKSGALGLTQIMPFWLEYLCPAGIACVPSDLFVPEVNLDAAAYVYAAQGPAAWSQTW